MCVYVCMYVCFCARACMCACVYVCMCARVCVRAHCRKFMMMCACEQSVVRENMENGINRWMLCTPPPSQLTFDPNHAREMRWCSDVR